MNCVQLERWLDEGDVAQVPAEVAEHAGSCARCARALAAARSLESALATHFSSEPAATPAQFTARVLDRIDALEAKRSRVPFVSDALPWWVRVATEPSVIGATVIVAALLWQGDTILSFTRAGITRAAAAPLAAPLAAQPIASGLDALWSAFKPLPGADWTVAIAFAVGLAPLFALAGWALWRAGERLSGGTHTAA
ncbi:MAG: hypothetical protein K8R56_03200 [Candidatus Eisenbacteria bacterium]|nr:hypothetical protein [Candidatus Eisenbacteria bacterium]